jgi:hypothetical protein
MHSYRADLSAGGADVGGVRDVRLRRCYALVQILRLFDRVGQMQAEHGCVALSEGRHQPATPDSLLRQLAVPLISIGTP